MANYLNLYNLKTKIEEIQEVVSSSGLTIPEVVYPKNGQENITINQSYFVWKYNPPIVGYQYKYRIKLVNDTSGASYISENWRKGSEKIYRYPGSTAVDTPIALVPSTNYRFSVQILDSLGRTTPWSEEIVFKTAASETNEPYIIPPKIIYPLGESGFDRGIIIDLGNEFEELNGVGNPTLSEVQWEILSYSFNWSNTTNKISISVPINKDQCNISPYHLDHQFTQVTGGGHFKVRCRFKDDQGHVSDWSNEGEFYCRDDINTVMGVCAIGRTAEKGWQLHHCDINGNLVNYTSYDFDNHPAYNFEEVLVSNQFGSNVNSMIRIPIAYWWRGYLNGRWTMLISDKPGWINSDWTSSSNSADSSVDLNLHQFHINNKLFKPHKAVYCDKVNGVKTFLPYFSIGKYRASNLTGTINGVNMTGNVALSIRKNGSDYYINGNNTSNPYHDMSTFKSEAKSETWKILCENNNGNTVSGYHLLTIQEYQEIALREIVEKASFNTRQNVIYDVNIESDDISSIPSYRGIMAWGFRSSDGNHARGEVVDGIKISDDAAFKTYIDEYMTANSGAIPDQSTMDAHMNKSDIPICYVFSDDGERTWEPLQGVTYISRIRYILSDPLADFLLIGTGTVGSAGTCAVRAGNNRSITGPAYRFPLIWYGSMSSDEETGESAFGQTSSMLQLLFYSQLHTTNFNGSRVYGARLAKR